eukprot:SAG11_NODE_759_length_7305_cov_2.494865_3_plen_52_part_00
MVIRGRVSIGVLHPMSFNSYVCALLVVVLLLPPPAAAAAAAAALVLLTIPQ